MDWSELDSLIGQLEKEVGGLDPRYTRWKALWDSIRTIGASFKDTRYPTKAQKDQAWERFQGLVAKTKASGDSARGDRERFAHTSRARLSEILTLARAATPPSGWEETVYALTFGMVETVIRGAVKAVLPGPDVDEVKAALDRYSERLAQGWNLLSASKAGMLKDHKDEAFQALSTAKERLDAAWARWKGAKQRAWEAKQQAWQENQRAWQVQQEERRERRDDFERRVHTNIENLRERKEKLRGVLQHKASNLERLYSMRADARSSDYRDRVTGWIDEESEAIRDIRSKIESIESWIDEERAKLRS